MPSLAAAALVLVLALFLSACSSVFTSSIAGTIVDMEAADDGTVTGVSNANVYLYIDQADCLADLAAWVEGDDSSLPDAPTKAEYLYFQSTATDVDGGYQFNGFVWQTLFPQFGKTADRHEVFLLIYHPDYGLWPNPVPLFIVSDVTTQLARIEILDLWHDAKLTGRVTDWSNYVINSGTPDPEVAEDQLGLTGVSVSFYVAEEWDYDADGNIIEAKYPSRPTGTATTGDDGYWTADLRFPMQPNRAEDLGQAPVRITYGNTNYRANDYADGTDLDNRNGIGGTAVGRVRVDQDFDDDGRTATVGDWDDAFQLITILRESDDEPLNEITPVMMQRWRFSTTVRGRVWQYDVPDTPPKVYLNGVKVTLATANQAGDPAVDYTAEQTVGEDSADGYFNFGTVSWDLSQILNGDPALLDAARKAGRINYTVDLPDDAEFAATWPLDAELTPGQAVNLELEFTP
ncbi:MAG: hypothetical protein A2087_06805 [Spirochaetes bacterium GWD1_61_31]|nr:MAG: hypothetical protein A2Y37_08665 [Spirochaetes bacterium GWB1_60_80]OHD31846.1 MAG: hypothetical protein A2004_10040 [Spirochaetes bacterium GWC1_61_12]OHD40058.1 MAG: hypothetical protein A2087_06805 [Spirochaetes bacterium GWD1_61_31]OHD45893.1 MAG: hypothetical protein A2Y35_04300 [Spirochaetes bacterium GWE1_60_18]OHD58437.1 MAG: hypothetical protein A2Y32_06690 [Spirochaetes bacterium GWF1_60_12]HAP44015.1 hypothetical protein [Spirochaetaceae bacterium]